MMEAWSEKELDALWVGVRRHGQGNWACILRDSTLKFSEHRTSKDLSERWEKEVRQISMIESSRSRTNSLFGS
ncbi:hypothetical protein CICLE_v10006165mg [Citrus x clementina]|uniref:Myb-like domain-containing protein n=1 Tax=Citrus clementina TaxID=85681 RepID=V4RML1_CITCL|nr:hypothetical protein CICLE_v10006165mg [Citrus x clementina]